MSGRFKGIECDQCGMPMSKSLHLRMSVNEVFTHRPKGQHVNDEVQFYADFCSKECMSKFLDRAYFESKMEVIENE
jgi:hypothetical protein